MKLTKYAAAAVLAAGMTLSAHAVPIVLGGPLPTFRTATLGSATAGFTGTDNATEDDVDISIPGFAPWNEEADIAGGSAGPGSIIDGRFTVETTSGNWGSKKVSGNWSIDASFWTFFDDAAISLHVGGGGNPGPEPDHFIWLIERGATSGSWSYDGTGLGGGGLSNLKLYSSGTPHNAPDGGSTLALVGLAIAGLGLARRKLS